MHAQKLCKIFFQSLCLLHSYHIQARMRVALPVATRHATTDKPFSVCLSVCLSVCRCVQTAYCVSSSFVLNFLTWVVKKKIERPYLESLLFIVYQHLRLFYVQLEGCLTVHLPHEIK